MFFCVTLTAADIPHPANRQPAARADASGFRSQATPYIDLQCGGLFACDKSALAPRCFIVSCGAAPRGGGWSRGYTAWNSYPGRRRSAYQMYMRATVHIDGRQRTDFIHQNRVQVSSERNKREGRSCPAAPHAANVSSLGWRECAISWTSQKTLDASQQRGRSGALKARPPLITFAANADRTRRLLGRRKR